MRVLRVGGLYFNGINNYVSVPRAPSLNVANITIALWACCYEWPAQLCILDRNDYYAVGFYSGYMASHLRTPARWRVSPTLRSLNTWYHISVTYDGVTRRHYVNGDPDGSWVEGAPLEVYDSVRLIIGANANDTDTSPRDPSGFFRGIVDEVRIYNRALSDAEVKALYEGRDVRDGLVLYLPMDEYEGNTLYDRSGYNNHGTIYGATWVVKKAARVLKI